MTQIKFKEFLKQVEQGHVYNLDLTLHQGKLGHQNFKGRWWCVVAWEYCVDMRAFRNLGDDYGTDDLYARKRDAIEVRKLKDLGKGSEFEDLFWNGNTIKVAPTGEVHLGGITTPKGKAVIYLRRLAKALGYKVVKR